MKKLLSIYTMLLLMLASYWAYADSGNKVEITFSKAAKITDFKFIEGSDVTKEDVSFKHTTHSISKDKIEIKAVVSSRSGSFDVDHVRISGGRFNLAVVDSKYGPCEYKCNFLFNAEMSINGKRVPWDFVFGQGHNRIQMRNFWFVGFQQEGHLYGVNTYHKGCKSFSFDGSVYSLCKKGASKFELKKKS